MADNPSLSIVKSLLNPDQKASLLQELNLDSLPEDRQQELSQMMIDLVLASVFERVSAVLTENDLNYLDSLVGSGQDDNDEIVEYIRAKVPNFNVIVEEEIEKFQTEVKGNVAAMLSELPENSP